MSLEKLRDMWSKACDRRKVSSNVESNGTTVDFYANGSRVTSVATASIGGAAVAGVIIMDLERVHPLTLPAMERKTIESAVQLA